VGWHKRRQKYGAHSFALFSIHGCVNFLRRKIGTTPSTSFLQKRFLGLLCTSLSQRVEEKRKIAPEAGDFAPRLDGLHRTLDRAVCDAYGWNYTILDDEEEILRRLLALNLERAAASQEDLGDD